MTTEPITIGLVGKYVDLPDAYLSVVEALKHAGFHHEAAVDAIHHSTRHTHTCWAWTG